MMTYEKLNALFGMRERIEDARERLMEIKANMGAGAAPLTGMPFGPGGNSDKVGDLALKAIEVSAELETEILMYEEALYEAEIFILRLDDPVLQRVIHLRFIDGHTWQEVSNRIHDGYYSEDNCRKMVVNYLARVNRAAEES